MFRSSIIPNHPQAHLEVIAIGKRNQVRRCDVGLRCHDFRRRKSTWWRDLMKDLRQDCQDSYVLLYTYTCFLAKIGPNCFSQLSVDQSWRMTDGFLSKPSWLNCHWATHFRPEQRDVRGIRRWVNAFSGGNALCYRTDCWMHTSSWWSIHIKDYVYICA